MIRYFIAFTAISLILSCASENNMSSNSTSTLKESYTVLLGGTKVGSMSVSSNINKLDIEYGFKNNGRGPNSTESLSLSDSGIPINWTIDGATTFGNKVSENFSVKNGIANWSSAAGTGQADFSSKPIYIAQNASPYALYIYAKALLSDDDQSIAALPAGILKINKVKDLVLTENGSDIDAHIYSLSGIDLAPDYLALDKNLNLMAFVSSRFALIRKGYEHEDERLRTIAAELNASRFRDISARVTHKYNKPVRIQNVRIFDPITLSLSPAKSVVVTDQRISAIESNETIPGRNEVIIDGAGGTLVPGLYEMHGHMSDNDALLNVLAGVTSVRDMGNEVDVLELLIENIENNVLIGPRITKSGFIEGKSEFNSATGELASTQEEAVQLVRDYAARDGYHQIKIYSSINPDWVPAMAAEAHQLGMRVAGHIPAFTTADEMIAAGYDEITHINQVMLGWVLNREEDTRTLFRITGMQRFVDLDLSSDKVQKTLNAMVENNIAVDPTTVIHELAMTGRNGETRTGVQDYIANMPIGVQRSAKSALLNVSNPKEDAAYRKAYAKILETLKLMHDRGIFIVPGTDLGGAFELHRELELFQEFGMTPAEILRRGSYDMANYLGYGKDLGSIEPGKLADFFLVPGDPTKDLKAIKTISLVSRGGDFYFPSEVYPEFGIKPFTGIPKVNNPDSN